MIKKSELINLLGGTPAKCAHRLGYSHKRADNNIIRLPDTLTPRQAAAVIQRMKAKRIKVPESWKNV